MNLIELHMLQSFPVTCLNRDDVGAPKTAMFGGVQRARVSSQSWKRAIRGYTKEIQPKQFAGNRSRYVLNKLREILIKKGQSEACANIMVEHIAGKLGKLDNLEKGNVKTLLFFSPQELENMSEAMLNEKSNTLVQILANGATGDDEKKKAQTELEKIAGKAVKAMAHAVKDAADIAVFGRMVADDHTLKVDGAGLFSHALSTHRVNNEIDFFSAVDDLKPEDSEGAGHIGTLEFNSACYYRYAGLNLNMLEKEHLKHFSPEELKSVEETFIRAVVLSIPVARKNSMFGFTPPSYVLGLRREGQPISLVNAFEQAVRPSSKGYILSSMEALKLHYRNLKRIYNLVPTAETSLPNITLDSFLKNLLEGNSDDKTASELNGNED